MTIRPLLFPLGLSVAIAASTAACGSATLTEPADYTVAAGQAFSIDLRTPGDDTPLYDTLPQVSSMVVHYLGVTQLITPMNLGGTTQVFTFEAATPGRFTISFVRPLSTAGISRTVEVQ